MCMYMEGESLKLRFHNENSFVNSYCSVKNRDNSKNNCSMITQYSYL